MERWQQQSRQRFAILALVSLGLHLPLLMTFDRPTLLPATNTASSISVELVTHTEDKEPAREPEPTRSKTSQTPQQTKQLARREKTHTVIPDRHAQQRKTEQAKQTRQNQQDEKAQANQAPENQPDKTVTTKQPAEQASNNQAQVQHKLQLELQNHFYYPRLARRHGYQGTVTLSFELHRQGAIGKIQILQSSGHRILDLAAKDAVRKMTVNWASELLYEPSMQIELPVQYILTEG